MAYCVADDVKRYAPPLVDKLTGELSASVDVAGHIAAADGIIDSRLRSLFEVPFAAPDRLIVEVSAKLAAAAALKAHYSGLQSGEPSQYATSLEKEGLDTIAQIISNPSLISQEKRTSTPDGGEKSTLTLNQGRPGAFTMGEPEEWL